MAELTVAEFQAMNRAPVFPGLWNRWTLLRTGRDSPTDEEVAQTTAAVFARWFGGGSSLLDPSLTWDDSTRSGAADLIRMRGYESAASYPMMAALKKSEMTSRQRRDGAVTTREMAPGPLQMIAAGGVGPLRVHVTFVWRSQQETVPWPVWRQTWLPSREASLEPSAPKDWALDRVHEPTSGAPPEMSSWEKIESSAGDAVLAATNPVAEVLDQSSSDAGKVIVASAWVLGTAYVVAKLIEKGKGR